MKDYEEFLRRMSKIETLIREIEITADSKLRNSALELMQLLMELNGVGFDRMLQIIQNETTTNQLSERLADDRLLASLLSLYGLHPEPINSRIEKVIAQAQSELQPQGCQIELISMQDLIVHLRVKVQSNSRISITILKSSIEEMIFEKAPDINSIEFDVETITTPALVQLQRGSKKDAIETNVASQHSNNQSHCQICNAALTNEHQHMVELTNRKLLCACRACAFLFENGSEKYRLVGRRRLLLTSFSLTDRQWQELAIPIGMAFFFYNSSIGKMVAVYPSPAGPAEPIEFNGWDEIVNENPILQDIYPDIEALLVNRLDKRYGHSGAPEYYIVPIDECYRLIGLIRAQWQGFSGGSEVWATVAQFFRDLKSNAQSMG